MIASGSFTARELPDKPARVCRWCGSPSCTPSTSPHCYCLDCESPLDPCRCRPDCKGGNCYQPCCGGPPSDRDTAEAAKLHVALIELSQATPIVAPHGQASEWTVEL